MEQNLYFWRAQQIQLIDALTLLCQIDSIKEKNYIAGKICFYAVFTNWITSFIIQIKCSSLLQCGACGAKFTLLEGTTDPVNRCFNMVPNWFYQVQNLHGWEEYVFHWGDLAKGYQSYTLHFLVLLSLQIEWDMGCYSGIKQSIHFFTSTD